MKTGISTACLYPLETEQALEQLIRRGFDHFEVFVNSFSELDGPVAARLVELSRSRDVVSLHPFSSGFETMLFFSDYPRRTQDGLELYRRFCDLATRMGASFLVFHGAHRGMPLTMPFYAQRYARLHETARSMGITLVHENVERSVSRDPELFRVLRREIPDAAFALDLKQAVRAGFTPLEMIQAMGPNLRHVHISDAGPQESCLPVGKGTVDFPQLLAALREQGFDGCLALELYSTSYQDPQDLERSVAALERMVEDLSAR